MPINTYPAAEPGCPTFKEELPPLIDSYTPGQPPIRGPRRGRRESRNGRPAVANEKARNRGALVAGLLEGVGLAWGCFAGAFAPSRFAWSIALQMVTS